MNDQNNDDLDLSIPDNFFSDSEEKPFTHCKVCEVDLTKVNIPYSIEKAFKRTPQGEDLTLFEIAICMNCAEKQSKKMSVASRSFIEKTTATKTFFKNRNKIWENGWRNHWNNKCIFTNNEIKNNEEYHIVGHFIGNKVMPRQAPFVIGEELIQYIQENLSLETKEEMDDFGQNFLGPDPRIAALLKDYQFVMV